MPAAHTSVPIGNLGLKSYRERLIRTKPVHELYGHLARRRRRSEQDIARALRAGPAVRAWVGDRLVGLVRALSDGRSLPQIGVKHAVV
jgi:hypothetical protein